MKKRTQTFMRWVAVIVLMLSVAGINSFRNDVTASAKEDEFGKGGRDEKVTNTLMSATAKVLDFDADLRSEYAVIQCLSGCSGSAPSPENWESGDEISWTPRKQRGLKLFAGNPFETKKRKRTKKELAESFSKELTPPSTPGSSIRWHIRLSGDGSTFDYDFGMASDFFVPADYDGDGKWDIGVWRPSDQYFYVHITGSANGAYVTYGPIGDEYSDPTVTGDYDGDGKADPAVFTGTNWIWLGGAAHTTQTSVPFGVMGVYPAPGDYNGDGKYDFAYQTADPGAPSPAHFYIDYNGTGNPQSTPDLDFVFGNFSDVIVPGDYDGDGKTDIATANYQTPSINWTIRFTVSGTTVGPTSFGDPSIGYTAQADYDGDGMTDLGFWNNSPTGIFYYDNYATSFSWGGPTDYPVAYFNSH